MWSIIKNRVTPSKAFTIVAIFDQTYYSGALGYDAINNEWVSINFDTNGGRYNRIAMYSTGFKTVLAATSTSGYLSMFNGNQTYTNLGPTRAHSGVSIYCNDYNFNAYGLTILRCYNPGRLELYVGSTGSYTEQTPGGAVNLAWSCCCLLPGNIMLAAVNGGKIYYKNGTTWSETQPLGNANANWSCCAVSSTGKRVAAVNGGRIYYYDGSSWSEATPGGSVDLAWKFVSIYENTILAGVFGGRLYYFDGSSWVETRPLGDADAEWTGGCIRQGRMTACVNWGSIYFRDGASSSWSDITPNEIQKPWVSVQNI